jgi:hypothetical protein
MMRFSEFFLFCLDKMLVTNKNNFKTFLEAFVKTAPDQDKLDIHMFPNLMTTVAKLLIPNAKYPILKLLNEFLGNKTEAVMDRSKLLISKS